MKKKFTVVIFTDLDGSLLHRDTFKFDTIKDYIKSLVSKGVIIIPNSSKTEKEIEKFNEELGVNLPFISENGSSIHGLNLITSNFPDKIVLSREKEELFKIFENKVPEKLKEKCFQISKMSKKEQENILGQKDAKLKDALNRKYTLPFLFKGDKNEKNKLLKVLNSNSLFNELDLKDCHSFSKTKLPVQISFTSPSLLIFINSFTCSFNSFSNLFNELGKFSIRPSTYCSASSWICEPRSAAGLDGSGIFLIR